MAEPTVPTVSGFVEVEGAQLFYEVAGSGPPLALLHGGWLDRRIWDAQLLALAQRFQVIRYDLRGFGRSNLPPRPYSDVQDLYGLLSALRIERAALLGLSLGGMLAIDFALANPAMVAALVLVGPGLRGFTPSPEDESTARTTAMIEAVQAEDRARALDLFVELWVDGPGRQAALDVRRLVRSIAADYSFAHLAPGAPQPSQTPSAIERLATIRAPTLILAGARDQPQILEIAGLLEVEIPRSRRVLIPGAAHLPNLEQPALFNQTVLQFLMAEAG